MNASFAMLVLPTAVMVGCGPITFDGQQADNAQPKNVAPLLADNPGPPPAAPQVQARHRKQKPIQPEPPQEPAYPVADLDLPTEPPPKPVEPPRRETRIGDEVRFVRKALLAVDDPAWDAMREAIGAQDKYGLFELMVDGKVFAVDRGYRAKLLKRSFSADKVRITEGPQIGKAGWVVSEFVQDAMIPLRPDRPAKRPDIIGAKGSKDRLAWLMSQAKALEGADNRASAEYYKVVCEQFPRSAEAKRAWARLKVLNERDKTR
jgi:hypothetical protein